MPVDTSVSTGAPRTFVIFALPRSRTAWLSRFLSYGDWNCGHDELRHARSLEDVKAWLSMPNTGTAETLASPWWRTLRKLRPDAKVVIVRRPIGEVVDSLSRVAGISVNKAALASGLTKFDAKLTQIAARWPGALEVSFASLDEAATCKAIFEHCLPYPFDLRWWENIAPINIQCSVPHLIRYIDAFRPQIEKLAKVAKFDAIADMMAARKLVEPIGVTLQGRTIRDAWAQPLYGEFGAN
jgi:hypothetical protein